MKARYIQRGESIDYVPESDVPAGEIVRLGNLVGVTKLDIKGGELGALALTGVYEVETGGRSINHGEIVSLDTETGKAVASGTPGSVVFGYAVGSAIESDTTICVLLSQGMN